MSNSVSSASIIEAYQGIRSNIISALSEKKGCRVIAVASPTSGEGASTTAINLAVAFGKLGGKTLIIDADMRNGTVDRRLRTPSSFGLSELLEGKCGLDNAILPKDTYLDLMPAGRKLASPEALLCSEEFESLISGLRFAYDYIIVDSPAICETADALYITKQTDGLVLVLGEGKSKYSKIDSAMKLLERAKAPLLGSVINASREGL